MKFYDVIYTITKRSGDETLVSTFFSQEEAERFIRRLSSDSRVAGWDVEVY